MEQKLFVKPVGMKYTTMAMWIDENIYQDDCDYNTAFTYMYLLADMLARTKKYFVGQQNVKLREEFSAYLAYSTFKRMTDSKKGPVKSVLNYMKSIINFRKAEYEGHRHQEIITPEYNEEWDSNQYYENLRNSFINRSRVEQEMCSIIDNLPRLVDKNIPKIYKSNKNIYTFIYISVLMSIYNRFALPEYFSSKIESKLNTPTFNEVKFYRRYLDESIILWNLKEDYNAVVEIVVNKIIIDFTKWIKDLTNDNTISNDELSFIASSSISTGGSNETDY